MKRKDVAIAGEMRISLDVAVAQLHGASECGNCVLRLIARAAAMRKSNRAAIIEEGMYLRVHKTIVDAVLGVVEQTSHFGTLSLVSVTNRFIECVNAPGRGLVLEEAALLIAAHAHHDLDVESALRSIDQIGQMVNTGELASLRSVLFDQYRLRGDTDTYYDPNNSYLDSVLTRRTGIPITLSVLTIAVGRRASIPLSGVGLPGHFLVGVLDHPGMYLDPFAGGKVLDTGGCIDLFHQLHGTGASFEESMLTPVDSVSIVDRMLNNLLAIFRSEGDTRSQLWVARLRSYLPGASISQQADVAVVLANGGQFDAAAEIFDSLAHVADDDTAGALLAARDRMRSRMN